MRKQRRRRERPAAPRPPRPQLTELPIVCMVGAWAIRVLPWPSYGDRGRWWSVSLHAPRRPEFGVFALGFNGGRLAVSHDLRRLRHWHPGLADLVCNALREWAAEA